MDDNTITILKLKGFKMTKYRQGIFEHIKKSQYPISSEDIFFALKDQFPGLSLSTVYRNLETLSQANILKKLKFDNDVYVYEINGEDHHHHLICLGCGKAHTIDVCPYDPSILKGQEFRPVSHRFEIYGYCKRCDKKDI